MPLFEVDATRPLLVQSGQAAGTAEPGLATTAHRVVDSHIDGLLGEQIFPVAQGVGPDEPHLLALDATGSPVVVELVAELDRSALTRALDHAGWAGRLTRGELASRYHGGPNAFQRDIAAFYDSVPITRSQPGRSSARLIVICQEAGEEILNAVDFLRQPTMPVEVLKMGVMHTQDGRRFVDVSPLVIHPASGATSPQLSGAAPAARTAVADGDGTFAEGVQVGLALTDRQPVPSVTAPTGAGTAAQPVVARPAAARRSERTAAPTSRSAARAAAAAAAPAAEAAPAAHPAERAPERPPAPRSRAARREQTGPRSLALPAVPPAPAPAASHAPVPPPPPAAPEPPRRRSRADRFRPGAPAPEVTPELAAFTAASAGSAEDLDLAELARRTTSPASADTATLGEDFARAAAPSFRRSVPRAEPAPWDAPAPRAHEPRPWDPPAPRAAEPAPWDRSASRAADPLDTSVPLSAMEEERPWSPSTPERWTSASDDLPRLEVPPLEAPSYTPPPERDLYDTGATAVTEVDEVDGDLVALASVLGQPTRLVWERPRRRQRFDAVLHPDGVIELPDGTVFRHPDRAATAACGAPTDDGWNVWRLEPEGLSLLEAYRARFA
ncbi:hypothetical protein [Isoptericola dokdonensis]|uniref:RAMA domain-containing protein n=1 Tax=Isoptericola dokdonensis DS-3 TaxID=1300344 RepID=A0A168FU64_9MICO|nr:hypothetical protein [Isoptericola dokdonensis]ANC32516.1 hypothetical protein I598_3000 [Isoptericola dokdonensis DS-3]